MTGLLFAYSSVSLLLAGAIFGFFYAWLCSTMRDIDADGFFALLTERLATL